MQHAVDSRYQGFAQKKREREAEQEWGYGKDQEDIEYEDDSDRSVQEEVEEYDYDDDGTIVSGVQGAFESWKPRSALDELKRDFRQQRGWKREHESKRTREVPQKQTG